MASLRKFTATVTADGAGDANVEAPDVSDAGYRAPLRVLRVDIDDSAAAGAGSSEVDDELGTILAADDPTTNLFTFDDVGNQTAGVLCAGPITFILTGWAAADVITFTVFFDNG